MRTVFTLFLLVHLAFIAAAQKAKPYTSEMRSTEAFLAFSGPPLVQRHAAAHTVKVLYEKRTQRLYFINYHSAKLHYEFAQQHLGDEDPLFVFNQKNYEQVQGRKYYLGNLTWYRSSNRFVLDFSAGDEISGQQIKIFLSALQAAFIPGTGISVLTNTPAITAAVKGSDIPTVSPHELYAAQNLQLIEPGTACGTLRFIKAAKITNSLDYRNDILVIEGTVNELPLCRGVIINTFQTPLSHAVVLAHNRKTPFVACRNAAENSAIMMHVGKDICLEVRSDTFSLKTDTAGTNTANTAIRIQHLPFDTAARALKSLNEITLRDMRRFGAKACYLAELQRVPGAGKSFFTPQGAFAIPFYYYQQHLQRNGIDTLIRDLINDKALQEQPVKLSAALRNIRNAIKSAPVEKSLLAEISTLLRANGLEKGARFRSSSNAEDLASFNGAGLYDSKTGSLTDTSKPVEKALKAVWASAFTDRAFAERLHYNIAELDVYMAVLVHENFPDELANGVAITRNIYRDQEAGFVLNQQQGEVSVVSPPDSVTGELVISYFNTSFGFYNDKASLDYITYSSLNAGKPLLTVAEMKLLTAQLSKVKDHFYQVTKAWKEDIDYKDYALDIEYKILLRNGKRVILIKQARPYR